MSSSPRWCCWGSSTAIIGVCRGCRQSIVGESRNFILVHWGFPYVIFRVISSAAASQSCRIRLAIGKPARATKPRHERAGAAKSHRLRASLQPKWDKNHQGLGKRTAFYLGSPQRRRPPSAHKWTRPCPLLIISRGPEPRAFRTPLGRFCTTETVSPMGPDSEHHHTAYLTEAYSGLQKMLSQGVHKGGGACAPLAFSCLREAKEKKAKEKEKQGRKERKTEVAV